jgi:hypothetical protein
MTAMGIILGGTADLSSVVNEPGGSSNLALSPTSDFDPYGVSKIDHIKTLCNYETINKLFHQKKKTLVVILLQFRTILLPYKPLCYIEGNITNSTNLQYSLRLPHYDSTSYSYTATETMILKDPR